MEDMIQFFESIREVERLRSIESELLNPEKQEEELEQRFIFGCIC